MSRCLLAQLTKQQVSPAIGLHACYATSGTELVYRAILLRACYAIPGTELADAAIGLRACYAISGTELCMVLLIPCDVRY
eukprot:3027628-Rhodomonas_salina.1